MTSLFDDRNPQPLVLAKEQEKVPEGIDPVWWANQAGKWAAHALPFDPRTEVPADAKRIVTHLWIIFVILPVAIGILWAVTR